MLAKVLSIVQDLDDNWEVAHVILDDFDGDGSAQDEEDSLGGFSLREYQLILFVYFQISMLHERVAYILRVLGQERETNEELVDLAEFGRVITNLRAYTCIFLDSLHVFEDLLRFLIA